MKKILPFTAPLNKFEVGVVWYKLIETRRSSSIPTGIITVIIDGNVHIFDVEYDNHVNGDYAPIVFENNLHKIEGAYLSGEINQDGELRHAKVKSK